MKTTASRDEAMRAAKKRRLRVVFEIDVKAKGFNRRAFNQQIAHAIAEVVKASDGEPVFLSTEEVKDTETQIHIRDGDVGEF